MSKIYNFSAGPAALNEGVLKASAEAAIEFQSTGMSLMEMSHRSKPVVAMFEEAEANLIELLNIPSTHKVLFLQGGASLQFLMGPLNLAAEGATLDYADTGAWSAKAIKEGKNAGCKVNVVSSSKSDTYSFIPKDLNQSDDATFLHLTSNNTIYGTQYKTFPTPKNPNGYLVCDMSSDILSRPVDVSKFGLIYAGAQKNIGPSGLTVAIVNKELLGKTGRSIPTYLDYNTHIEADSMFNTPPVYSVLVANETFKWLKSIGGVPGVQAINERKANKLYAAIDESKVFKSPVAVEDRSPMNVTFIMENPELEPDFLAFTKERGLVTLAGHRSVGGFRASIYNAMPEAGVDALISAIKDFEAKVS